MLNDGRVIKKLRNKYFRFTIPDSGLTFFEIFQIPHLFLTQIPPLSPINIFLCKSREDDTVQAFYIILQMFKYASNDTILSAMYLNTNLCFIFWICISQCIYFS